MKTSLLKAILALVLAVTMLFPYVASAEPLGSVVNVEMPDDKQLPASVTDVARNKDSYVQSMDGYVSSDSDINVYDIDEFFTDTEVPIQIVWSEDVEQVYTSEDVMQWAQKLHLSKDTIAKLWKEYSLGALPPEAVTTVSSKWADLINKYKKFYESFGLEPSEIEALIQDIEHRLNITPPGVDDLGVLQEEVTVSDRTDPTSEIKIMLGDIQAEMAAILKAWAEEKNKKARTINLAKIAAGNQVYEYPDLYDPEKRVVFEGGDATLFAMLDRDNTGTLLKEAMSMLGDIYQDNDVLKVPRRDKQGNILTDENGETVYSEVRFGDFTVGDFASLDWDNYVEKMKRLNPNMTDEEFLALPTTQTMAKLIDPNRSQASKDSIVAELVGGDLKNKGFNKEELYNALVNMDIEALERNLQKSRDMLDPTQDGLDLYNTNTASLVLAEVGNVGSNDKVFAQEELDFTSQTRGTLQAVQWAYDDTFENVTSQTKNMVGKTPEQLLLAFEDSLGSNFSSYFGESSTQDHAYCWIDDNGWVDHPLGELTGTGTTPADKLYEGLKNHPEWFNDVGFTINDESLAGLESLYYESISSIMGINLEFSESDYVPTDDSTDTSYVVSEESATQMKKNINAAVDVCASLGLNVNNATAETGFSVIKFNMDDPNETQAYIEAMNNAGLTWRDSNDSVADYAVDLNKLEKTIRDTYTSHGISEERITEVCSSIEMYMAKTGTNTAHLKTSFGNYTGAETQNNLISPGLDVDYALYYFMDVDIPEEVHEIELYDVPYTDINNDMFFKYHALENGNVITISKDELPEGLLNPDRVKSVPIEEDFGEVRPKDESDKKDKNSSWMDTFGDIVAAGGLDMDHPDDYIPEINPDNLPPIRLRVTSSRIEGKKPEEIKKEWLEKYVDNNEDIPYVTNLKDDNINYYYPGGSQHDNPQPKEGETPDPHPDGTPSSSGLKINDTVYSGNWYYDDDTWGWFTRLGGIELDNNYTGQKVQIQGIKNELGLAIFFNATNGKYMLQDSMGKWRELTMDQITGLVKQTATDNGKDPNLIGNAFVYVDNGDQRLGITADTAGLMDADNPLPLEKLKQMMGAHNVSLALLAILDGLDRFISPDSFEDVWFLINPNAVVDEETMVDWRKAAYEYFMERGIIFSAEELDQIYNLLYNFYNSQEYKDAYEEKKKEVEDEIKEENEPWTWDEILAMFVAKFGPIPTDMDKTEYILAHLADFLETYNGQKLFTVNRIITKQVSDITVNKSSTKNRLGGYQWRLIYPSGSYSVGGGTSTSLPILYVGPNNTAACYAQVQEVYLENTCYDYTEEWVLEGLDKNYVIYSREIKGYLPGSSGDGQNRLTSIVRYSPASEPQMIYSETHVGDEEENQTNNIGEGVITLLGGGKYGLYLNGYLYVLGESSEIVMNAVPETSTYRVD